MNLKTRFGIGMFGQNPDEYTGGLQFYNFEGGYEGWVTFTYSTWRISTKTYSYSLNDQIFQISR